MDLSTLDSLTPSKKKICDTLPVTNFVSPQILSNKIKKKLLKGKQKLKHKL